MRTIAEHGSLTLCFCSRKHGERQRMVLSQPGRSGALVVMAFSKVFPLSAISPGFSLLTLGHSLGAVPAPVGTRRSASHGPVGKNE